MDDRRKKEDIKKKRANAVLNKRDGRMTHVTWKRTKREEGKTGTIYIEKENQLTKEISWVRVQLKIHTTSDIEDSLKTARTFSMKIERIC